MDDIKRAIAHYEYGISHDIFAEPVLTYARTAVTALQTLASTSLNQKLADMALELDIVKAERNAAVSDIKSIAKKGDAWMCPYCRHAKDTDHGFADCEIDIGQCQMPYSMFEWRGPQKEHK